LSQAEVMLQTPELIYIRPQDFAATWNVIAHLVPSILERSRGRVDLHSFVDAIMTEHTSLFIVWDGQEALSIVGLEIGFSPSGLKLGTIRFASGKDSPRWLHLLDEMEDKARQSGCQALEIIARKGWERKLPSYKLTHVFLEKALT
jgi:hypothetical protein